MRAIRGGKGLGDALYVQSVARYLVERGERLTVCTSWPEVFHPLGDSVALDAFRRDRIEILAHYSMRKRAPTRQWQDVCISSRIPTDTPLRLDWPRVPHSFGWHVREQAEKSGRRKLLLVQMPRTPMDRKDAFGATLLPDCGAVQQLIWMARDLGAYVVQIGAGKALYRFHAIDMDLSNRTTVTELIDLACEADAFLGYVSFIVPLAESLDKPALLVWSARGLKDAHEYVRQITPQKVLEKPTSRWVMDNAAERQLQDAANELL